MDEAPPLRAGLGIIAEGATGEGAGAGGQAKRLILSHIACSTHSFVYMDGSQMQCQLRLALARLGRKIGYLRLVLSQPTNDVVPARVGPQSGSGATLGHSISSSAATTCLKHGPG